MKTSQRGIDLIKGFEGCKLVAYKPVPTEQYWTIGYGHYGADVKPGEKISQAQAEMYLKADLEKFERAVDALGLPLNQNQYDALVSFAYNCGVGNLRKLCEGRTLSQIADKMLAYNKGGGRVLAGLTRRRNAERALFLTGVPDNRNDDPNRNPYDEPTKNVKLNTRGNDARWVQCALNKRGAHLVVDGIFGVKSVDALKQFQFSHGLVADGICGEKTRAALKK
jgi:GH24 family phage-related lysozyme (muramidase)